MKIVLRLPALIVCLVGFGCQQATTSPSASSPISAASTSSASTKTLVSSKALTRNEAVARIQKLGGKIEPGVIPPVMVLTNSKLSDAQMDDVVASMNAIPDVAELNIAAAAHLTDAGILKLKGVNHLRRLHVSPAQNNLPVIQELRKANPNLGILFPFVPIDPSK